MEIRNIVIAPDQAALPYRSTVPECEELRHHELPRSTVVQVGSISYLVENVPIVGLSTCVGMRR